MTKPGGLEARVISKRTWSPSSLKLYEECPSKYNYQNLQKLCPQCFSPSKKCGHVIDLAAPLARGQLVHSDAENLVSGRVTWEMLPVENQKNLEKVRDILDDLRESFKAREVRTELELAFTKDWGLTKWLAGDVHCRFKLDVVKMKDGVVTVGDWKTGKYKPEDKSYQDQLSLYNVAALSAGLGDVATSKLIFTDSGRVVDGARLEVKDLGPERAKWEGRVLPMMVDEVLAPTPSPGCRWCPYSINREGPCVY